MTGHPCTTSDHDAIDALGRASGADAGTAPGSAGPVYLDHAATTPVRPEALAAMAEVYRSAWANPSSVHAPGRRARALLEQARRQVADLLEVAPERLVFTSGGTEANNLALLGAAGAAPARRHVVVSAVEHHSVLDAARSLERSGYRLSVVPPDREGRVAAAALGAALRDDTAVAALMLANNEVGTIQPVAAAAAGAAARGVPLLVDAVAAAGKLPVHAPALGAAFLTLSAHKLGGPQGAGALYVAPGRELAPLLHGGGQERRWRPGTENVAAIVGFGVAAELARRELADSAARLRTLARSLEAAILGAGCGAVATGPADPEARVPGLVSLAFPGLDGDALLVALDLQGVAAGAGAACTSGSVLPSHVLTAMGLPGAACRAPLRLSLGPENSDADVARVVAAVARAARRQAAVDAP